MKASFLSLARRRATASLTRWSKSRGVGIIDVLVATLVLAGGVLGLAKLQSVVLEESSGSKARSVASQLALAKLEDLRSFSQTSTGGAGVFGYDEIGNNTGGSERVDGTLYLPSGNVTVGTVTYTRNWTAGARYFCTLNAAPLSANCVGAAAKTRPDFYTITVQIGWADSDGQAQSLQLEGSANSTDPLLASFALLATPSEGPIVTYVPGTAPQVIAIDTGGNRKVETTNPTPTLIKQGQKIINTIARYETISYDTSAQTLRRREFTTINCECTQLGVGTGEDPSGATVTKRIGEPADQFQAYECDVCCRDHHDNDTCDPTTDSGRKGCYDPYRNSGDYFASPGDHKHYDANGLEADDPGDVYVEACRMERIDGYLRVVPDWRLAVINAIPADFFTPSNVTAYGTYVKNYVTALLAGTTLPTPIWSSSEVVNQGSQRQFLARAIYLDYLDSSEKAAYAARIAASDPQVFQEIPFYEVNMTKLAQWTPSNTLVADVTNDQLLQESQGQDLYSRGLVTGVSPGTTNATARLRLGNTGVINEFISTDTQDGAEIQTSSVAITVPGTTYIASGTITGVSSSTVVTVTATGVSGSPNVACSYIGGSTSFSCTLPEGWNGAISASAAGYSFAPGSISISNIVADQSSLSFTASASGSFYTVSGSISPTVSDGSVTANGTGSNATVNCSYDAGTGAYSCVLPADWSGTLLPSSPTYTFDPGAYNVTSLSGDLAAEDFSATLSAAMSYTISGTIYAPPQVTVTMVPSPASGASCTAVAVDGSYSCTVPAGWTGGSLTPTVDAVLGAGITFQPAVQNYAAAISSDVSGQNFTTYYRISGKVSPNTGSTVVTGVTFTAVGSGSSSDGTCAAYNDADGTYACVVPGFWDGYLQPSKASTTFSPISRTYANVTSPYVDENYVATPVGTQSYNIAVTVSSLKNNQTAVTITAVSGLSCGNTTVSGSNPNQVASITCTVPAGWNGSITPLVPNVGPTETLSPASQSFTNVNAAGTASFTVVN